jgi:hypothetical protein
MANKAVCGFPVILEFSSGVVLLWMSIWDF